MALVEQQIGQEQLQSWLKAIGSYIMAVNKSMDSQQYTQTLQSVFPTQFEPGSLAGSNKDAWHRSSFNCKEVASELRILLQCIGTDDATNGHQYIYTMNLFCAELS